MAELLSRKSVQRTWTDPRSDCRYPAFVDPAPVSGAVLFSSPPCCCGCSRRASRLPRLYAVAKAVTTLPRSSSSCWACWLYMHHFCAGIRFLLLGPAQGSAEPARFSAVVFAVSITLTASSLVRRCCYDPAVSLLGPAMASGLDCAARDGWSWRSIPLILLVTLGALSPAASKPGVRFSPMASSS